MVFPQSTAVLDDQSNFSFQDDFEVTVVQDGVFADRTGPGAGPFEAFDDEKTPVECAYHHEDSDDDDDPPRRLMDQWAPQRGFFESKCWSSGVYSFPFDVAWTPWQGSDTCEVWTGAFPSVLDEAPVFGAEEG